MTTIVIPRSDATRDLLLVTGCVLRSTVRESPPPLSVCVGASGVPAPVHLSLAIPPRHLPTELRELLDAPRRTRMMRRDAARLRGEAVRDRHIELVERRHLPIEPCHRVRAQTIGPAQTRAHLSHTQLPQPPHGVIEPMILEMKPLADPQLRRVLRERAQRLLWRSILANQSHVEVPVVR